ncbi:hypothetical protein MPH_01862 [Macrophomina phaseolina MS6]|uniref:Uncharacterized protein n=1 Tax=Macrophomina phaseolina (strain MS6) TaxID=1126212 RepID=K2S1D1_MACPH|nr:hypothetical protein MPH_01862 [Macrophomina phaseolina MS6]
MLCVVSCNSSPADVRDLRKYRYGRIVPADPNTVQLTTGETRERSMCCTTSNFSSGNTHVRTNGQTSKPLGSPAINERRINADPTLQHQAPSVRKKINDGSVRVCTFSINVGASLHLLSKKKKKRSSPKPQ